VPGSCSTCRRCRGGHSSQDISEPDSRATWRDQQGRRPVLRALIASGQLLSPRRCRPCAPARRSDPTRRCRPSLVYA
jgi:hypothetical protein